MSCSRTRPCWLTSCRPRTIPFDMMFYVGQTHRPAGRRPPGARPEDDRALPRRESARQAPTSCGGGVSRGSPRGRPGACRGARSNSRARAARKQARRTAGSSRAPAARRQSAPQRTISPLLAWAARHDVETASAALTSQSTSIGNETTLSASTNQPKIAPTIAPQTISAKPRGSREDGEGNSESTSASPSRTAKHRARRRRSASRRR